MTSVPSSMSHRERFRQLVVAIESTPLFCAASSRLKSVASAVLLDRQPFDRMVRWRTVAKMLSMGLVVRRCFHAQPGSRRTPVACPDPCPGSRPPSHISACSSRRRRRTPARRRPWFRPSRSPATRVWPSAAGSRRLGDHIRGLVHPAALLARFGRPAGGLPEAECAIGDGGPRRHVGPRRFRSSSRSRPSCALSRRHR